MTQEIKKDVVVSSTTKEVVKQDKPIVSKIVQHKVKAIVKQEVTRGTLSLTLDRQLIGELRKRADHSRLSVSRYVELTLHKALRL